MLRLENHACRPLLVIPVTYGLLSYADMTSHDAPILPYQMWALPSDSSVGHLTTTLYPQATPYYTLYPTPYTLYPVQVGYLIVQENWVPEGMSHRKGGVRTDYPDIGDSRMVGYCRLQWYVPQQYRM